MTNDRLGIQLDDETYATAVAAAKELGIPVEELLRDVIADMAAADDASAAQQQATE